MSSAHETRASGPRAGEQQSAGYPPSAAYPAGDSAGMTGLAGWLMILGGFWSFFVGLALLVRKSYFTALPSYSSIAHYPYHWNLTAWGWTTLIAGILVVAVGVCVLLGQAWARWTGVVLVVLDAIASFLFLPIHPFWSLLVIAMDVFIVWALATARTRQDA